MGGGGSHGRKTLSKTEASGGGGGGGGVEALDAAKGTRMEAAPVSVVEVAIESKAPAAPAEPTKAPIEPSVTRFIQTAALGLAIAAVCWAVCWGWGGSWDEFLLFCLR